MKTALNKATIKDIKDAHDCDFTGRCLPAHQSNYSELREDGVIDGVPVSAYYMLTDDDCANDDLSQVDYEDRLDRIEIDICECDNQGISDEVIDALIEKLG